MLFQNLANSAQNSYRKKSLFSKPRPGMRSTFWLGLPDSEFRKFSKISTHLKRRPFDQELGQASDDVAFAEDEEGGRTLLLILQGLFTPHHYFCRPQLASNNLMMMEDV